MREDFVFGLARKIAQYRDPSLLGKIPAWVNPLVEERIGYYRRDGSYSVVSNLDEIDLVRQLAELLPALEHNAVLR